MVFRRSACTVAVRWTRLQPRSPMALPRLGVRDQLRQAIGQRRAALCLCRDGQRSERRERQCAHERKPTRSEPMLPLKHGPEASRSRRKFELAFAVGSCCLPCSWPARPSRRSRAQRERVVILPRELDELDPRYVGDAYGLKVSRLLYASLVTIDPRTLSPGARSRGAAHCRRATALPRLDLRVGCTLPTAARSTRTTSWRRFAPWSTRA